MKRTSTLLPRTIVLGACALSAGVHAGLVPAHLDDEPGLAAAFALAAIALGALAVALDRGHAAALAPAGALFAALLGGYAIAVLGGAGPLGREAPDVLGVATKLVELAGLGAVALLLVNQQQGEMT